MQQSSKKQGVRPPVPPFDEESARQKVKAAQDAWNTRDPQKASIAYTPASKWRNRGEFFEGREETVAYLKRKWARELDYRLEKDLWSFTGNRIAVRFEYERRDSEGAVVAQPRKRAVGVRREGVHAKVRRLHKRLQDRGIGAQDPTLATARLEHLLNFRPQP